MFSIRFVSRLFRGDGRRHRQPDRYKPVLVALESRLVPSGFNEFPVPGAPEGLFYDQLANQAVGASITTGPDGNLWFTHVADHAVVQITPDGTVTEFPLPRDTIGLFSITTGPDGNLWLGTMHFNGAFPNHPTFILRMTPEGDQSWFRARPDDSFPDDFIANFYGPTVGPDGNLWYHAGFYSSPNEDMIGRITPDGTVTNFGSELAGFDGLESAGGITQGPDGALYARIGDGLHGSSPVVQRIGPDGQLSDVIAATPRLGAMITGPDGNLWGAYGNVIERITLDGTVTDFHLPTQTHDHFGDVALNLTAGPDGNVWFTEPAANQIGSITPDGQITEYQVPTPNSQPAGITAGPDGNIWFTELGSGQIGQFVLGGGTGPAAPSAPASRGTPAENAATLNAVLAGGSLQAIDGVVNTQPLFIARVDTPFATSPPEALPTPIRPQPSAEASSPSHPHQAERAATGDVAGLPDTLTEDPAD
jgi:streptogramin lyase